MSGQNEGGRHKRGRAFSGSAIGVSSPLLPSLNTNHAYHFASWPIVGDPSCTWVPGQTPNHTHHITHPGFAEGHLPSLPSDTCLGVPDAENGTSSYTFVLISYPAEAHWSLLAEIEFWTFFGSHFGSLFAIVSARH